MLQLGSSNPLISASILITSDNNLSMMTLLIVLPINRLPRKQDSKQDQECIVVVGNYGYSYS